MKLTELCTYVRDLTGVHFQDIVSDALIKRFINEAYMEIATSQNWSWLERIDYLQLPAGASMVSTGTGIRRVQELVVAQGDIQLQGLPVTSLLRFSEKPVDLNAGSTVFYDVLTDGVEIHPVLNKDATVEIRYQSTPVNLTDEDSPLFAESFHAGLAYRAAGKVLTMQADEGSRVSFYAEEYNAFVERMVSEYVLSHIEDAFPIFETDRIV